MRLGTAGAYQAPAAFSAAVSSPEARKRATACSICKTKSTDKTTACAGQLFSGVRPRGLLRPIRTIRIARRYLPTFEVRAAFELSDRRTRLRSNIPDVSYVPGYVSGYAWHGHAYACVRCEPCKGRGHAREVTQPRARATLHAMTLFDAPTCVSSLACKGRVMGRVHLPAHHPLHAFPIRVAQE